MLANPVGGGGNGGAGEDHILIREEQISGSNGGTFTSGAWRTRVLNTKVYDPGNHATLASNQITLAKGTYRVQAHGQGYSVDRHKIRLYNVTDAVDLVVGTSEFSGQTGADMTNSFLEGRFVINDPKIIELQHKCQTTQATNGFGTNSGLGVIEVFGTVKFCKEA